MYSFSLNCGIIRDRKKEILMKVNIKLDLQYENERVNEEISGILKDDELFFVTKENNKMHFYLKERLFVRDTLETIFSYHFDKEGSLEIYLKEYQKGTRMDLTTEVYEVRSNALEVVYIVLGNEAKHHLKIEWEDKV